MLHLEVQHWTVLQTSPWPLTPAPFSCHNSATPCRNRQSMETVASHSSQPRGPLTISTFIRATGKVPSPPCLSRLDLTESQPHPVNRPHSLPLLPRQTCHSRLWAGKKKNRMLVYFQPLQGQPVPLQHQPRAPLTL